MTMTGLRVFDETLHATNTWLHELTSRLGLDDRQTGYRLLRLSLHAIRDRLPADEAAQLSAQLPLLLKGVFYEGWRPSQTPAKIRTIEEFLAGLRAGFSEDPGFDAESAFREVINVMKMHVSAGEIEDVRRVMPEEIKTLWTDDLAA